MHRVRAPRRDGFHRDWREVRARDISSQSSVSTSSSAASTSTLARRWAGLASPRHCSTRSTHARRLPARPLLRPPNATPGRLAGAAGCWSNRLRSAPLCVLTRAHTPARDLATTPLTATAMTAVRAPKEKRTPSSARLGLTARIVGRAGGPATRPRSSRARCRRRLARCALPWMDFGPMLWRRAV